MESTIHKFEAAGLGKAPFRFIRFEVKTYQACHGAPVQPGASCDYCATAISNLFWVRSADGREFKVGCDCIEKVGDRGLMRVVNEQKAAARRAKTAAKNTDVASQLRTLLSDADTRNTLINLPHPRGWAGRCFLDYAEWMHHNAGARGRGKLLKEIVTALKSVAA